MAFSPDQDQRDKAAFLHDLCKIESASLIKDMMMSPEQAGDKDLTSRAEEALSCLPKSTKVSRPGSDGKEVPVPSRQSRDGPSPEGVTAVNQYTEDKPVMGLSLAKIPKANIAIVPGGKNRLGSKNVFYLPSFHFSIFSPILPNAEVLCFMPNCLDRKRDYVGNIARRFLKS